MMLARRLDQTLALPQGVSRAEIGQGIACLYLALPH